jgi:chromosome segregation ATPase
MTGTVMFDGWPPQLVQGFVTLILGVFTVLGLIATAFGLWIRSTLRNNTNRQAAEASRQALEIATFKTSYEFVLEQAKRLTDRADKQDEIISQLREGKASDRKEIDMLNEQLKESRLHSRERDERLGELKAKLEQATQDRATQAARAAEMADRITELEDRQKERHEANTQLQLKIGEAEQERDAARAALKVANERIIMLEAQIKELTEPKPASEVVASDGAAPTPPAPVATPVEVTP